MKKISINPKNINKILVIRNHNQIGDMIVSVPMYYALKKKFPNSKIVLVAAKTNYPIPFFEINPFLDDVIVFDRSTIKSQIQIISYLRKEAFDVVIIPSTISISNTSHIIGWLTTAPIRVGVNSIDRVKNKLSFLLNMKKDFFWQKKHQLFRNLEIAELLGATLTVDEVLKIKFNFSESELDEARSFLKSRFSNLDKLLVAIHPGAGKESNIWDKSNFINLINTLNVKYYPNFLITCGATDSKIIKEMIVPLSQNKVNFEVLENFPVKKLAAIIELCDLFITNDTGIMHIGGWTNTAMISLFGVTRSYEWAPLGKNKFFIQSPTGSMEGISLEAVLNLVNSLISLTKSKKK